MIGNRNSCETGRRSRHERTVRRVFRSERGNRNETFVQLFLTVVILASLTSCVGTERPAESGKTAEETDGQTTSERYSQATESVGPTTGKTETPPETEVLSENGSETASQEGDLPDGPGETKEAEEKATVRAFVATEIYVNAGEVKAEIVRTREEWQQCPLKAEPILSDYAEEGFFEGSGLIVFQTDIKLLGLDHALVSLGREGDVLRMTVEIRADMSQKYEFGACTYAVVAEKTQSELEGIATVQPEVIVLLDGKPEEEYWQTLREEDLGKFGSAVIMPDDCSVIAECRMGEDPLVTENGGWIRSREEWNTLLEPYRGTSLYERYQALTELCDEKFFTDHVLAALQITAASASYRQIVRQVYPVNGKLTVVCEQRMEPGQTMDAAIGKWTVFIPVPREMLGDIETPGLRVIRTIGGIPCSGLR